MMLFESLWKVVNATALLECVRCCLVVQFVVYLSSDYESIKY